uniref:Uncharacterized protein n=1 Tax=Rhizophora mucronata TaxID=61149 RepID=A0A2P2IXF5_RHIMU
MLSMVHDDLKLILEAEVSSWSWNFVILDQLHSF